MTFHLTEQSLAKFQEKRKQWERDGKITTHLIDPSMPTANGKAAKESKNKYHNVKTEAEGMKFASRREARRWMDLRLMEKAKEIRNLKRQVRYKLDVNGIHVCDYVGDFTYLRGGVEVTEDVKGYRTKDYKLKAKLMLACLQIKILET